MSILYLDAETTTKNKGHPFDPDNKLISYSYLVDTSPVVFKYHTDPDFKSTHKNIIAAATEIVGANIKFDLHWFAREGNDFYHCKIWDVLLAEFIMSGQTAVYVSLNDTLTSYGMSLKDDRVKEYWEAGVHTPDIPVDVLGEYGNYDVSCLPEIVRRQKELMSPEQINLVYLLGEDMKTLIEAERHGIKWDDEKAQKKISILEARINEIESILRGYLGNLPDTFVFNWDSGDHISALLYGGTIEYEYSVPENSVYKSGPNKGQEYTRNRWYTNEVAFIPRFTPLPKTEVKKTREDPNAKVRFYQTDEPTLKQLKSVVPANRKLLSLLMERSEHMKILEMIKSIIAKAQEFNWQDGCIQAQFNQNVVITGRLSSSKPNMQNT